MAKKYVSNKDVSVRMFRSDLLESLSHVHPVVPHVIFLPLIAFMLFRSAQQGVAVPRIGLELVAGVLVWTLAEYVFHRFVFHAPARVESEVRDTVAALEADEPALREISGWRHVFYFIAHGVHHDFPNDSRRLVMPPSVSVPLALAFWLVFRAALGPAAAPAVFAGFVAGYLAYDTIHYAVHHFSLRNPVLLYLKKHHFRHHYDDSSRDFGVSSPLWDLVVGTYR